MQLAYTVRKKHRMPIFEMISCLIKTFCLQVSETEIFPGAVVLLLCYFCIPIFCFLSCWMTCCICYRPVSYLIYMLSSYSFGQKTCLQLHGEAVLGIVLPFRQAKIQYFTSFFCPFFIFRNIKYKTVRYGRVRILSPLPSRKGYVNQQHIDLIGPNFPVELIKNR